MIKEAQAVRNDLELLLKLQVIDYDLGELERSKDYLPDMMSNLTREIEEAKQKVVDTTKQLEETKVARNNLELDLKTKEANLQKYQQQMMSIKTNKEYDALVAEIDKIKKDISESETNQLQLMELVEKLEKDLETFTEQETQTVENNNRQLEILQEKIDTIGDKVSDKESNRQEIIDSIPKPILSTYERIRKGKGGRVVVTVKKRACSACFKALTPKKIQEIRRADTIHTCDNCGCLLYWDDDTSND